MTKRERETAEKYLKMLEEEEKKDKEFFKECKKRRSEIEAYFRKLDEQAERKARKSAPLDSATSAEPEEHHFDFGADEFSSIFSSSS